MTGTPDTPATPQPAGRLGKSSVVLVIAAIAFVLIYGGLGVGRDTTPRTHDLRNAQACAHCHTSTTDLTLTYEEPDLCYRCHADAVDHGTSHPIGIVVKDHTDPLLPLTKDNKMNCSTCHDSHGKSDHVLLLRRAGNDLCLACHKNVGHDPHYQLPKDNGK